MSLPILNTGNFCCFGLSTRVSAGLPGETQITAGLHATTKAPFLIDNWWRQQLGELEIAAIERCSLFLIAQTVHPYIDVPQLSSRLHSYLYAFLLQGVGYCRDGILLGGINSASGLRVTSFGWLDDYPEPLKVISHDLGVEHFRDSLNLAQGIDTLYADPSSGDYLRLRKGFNAFLSGIRFGEAHNRLHQFVRALDAVIKAKQGKATQQFKRRSQFFAGSSADDVQLLTELYELRSAAEHLNPLDDKLSKYQAHERDKMKALRTYQAELLASCVYRKILSTPALLSNFIDDTAIDQMWQQTTSQLVQLWGTTIDLQTAQKGLFFDYL